MEARPDVNDLLRTGSFVTLTIGARVTTPSTKTLGARNRVPRELYNLTFGAGTETTGV